MVFNSLTFKEFSMSIDTQAFAKSGLDLVALFGNTTFNSIERLAALNLSALRSFCEASFANYQTLLAAKDIQSFLKLQQDMASPALEQGIGYSRSVLAITNDVKETLSKEVEAKVAEVNTTVSGLVDKALSSAPAGSEVAVAAVKSAIAAANDAYEGINKAAKQIAEATEANVSAATEATIKAASASVKSAKKAA